MSRIVIVTLIYHRHKPIDISEALYFLSYPMTTGQAAVESVFNFPQCKAFHCLRFNFSDPKLVTSLLNFLHLRYC
jgi:hypothetical protein